MSDERWTKKRAAEQALQLSGFAKGSEGMAASNMGGITRTMHEIVRAFNEGSTKAGNESAPLKLALSHAVWLSSGKYLFDTVEIDRLVTECETIAQGDA